MAKVKHGKRYYKQMSLEVAVRNPERLEGILHTFSKFEGVKLDDNAILNIYAQLYLDKVTTSRDIDIDNASEEEIRQYVKTRTHNNEWGFPTGYQAAFTRYLKTLSEFGFIYSQYNEVFRISPVAKALLANQITLSEAFALQCMRYWRKSPYRRVLNDFNYFKFILDVIDRVNRSGHRLSYNQFLLSLFSDDGNVDDFINIITANIFATQDDVYAYILEHFSKVDSYHSRASKQSSCFNDYGDAVFRVLQLTGFITIEYEGVLLLSINNLRREFLEKLLELDFSIPIEAKENELLYFETTGSFNSSLLELIANYREQQSRAVSEYNMKIRHIIDTYELTQNMVAQYIKEVSLGSSDNRVFKFLQAPLKFEFLISLYLYLCLGDNYDYRPNYLCDEAGIPYSHAPGNIGDIEVYNTERYWLIEVTLIKGKAQQINNETINLFRHIDSTRSGAKYMSLIAPYIHEDTELLIKVATIVSMIETNSLIFAKPFCTNDFVSAMNSGRCIADIQEDTQKFILKTTDFLNKIASSYSIANSV